MKSFLVWVPVLLLYGGFLGWYVNWRGPVQPAETERFLQQMEASGVGDNGRNDLRIMRAFLEADDGREFFMLNLVRVAPGTVADPRTGEQQPARQVLEGYTGMFLPALFARAGHPVVVARRVGGYFDAWGVEADPGWTIVGYMRYRSRRDLAELATDPRFAGAHEFKFAAMPKTFSDRKSVV